MQISFDMLLEGSVRVKEEDESGVLLMHSKAFENTEEGRAELLKEYPAVFDEITAKWDNWGGISGNDAEN